MSRLRLVLYLVISVRDLISIKGDTNLISIYNKIPLLGLSKSGLSGVVIILNLDHSKCPTNTLFHT